MSLFISFLLFACFILLLACAGRSRFGGPAMAAGFALVCLVTACTPAIAAEMIPAHATAATASTFGGALEGFLRDTAFPVITAFLLGLVSLILNRLGQKYKIQALSAKNTFLMDLAAQGIALAQEKAAQLAGSRVQLTGNQKLDLAVTHLLSFAPKISRQQAEDLVHAVLAQTPGAGATGEAVTIPGGGFLSGVGAYTETVPLPAAP